MNLEIAHRKKTRIKLLLQGPSGSGKTFSSLLIAYGLCNDWTKIALIDTENESSHLYSHLGPYNVLSISPPFTPEKYIDAIQFCELAEKEIIIIDSITHEWEYLLELHSTLTGNSFTNWSRITPRHVSFLRRILQSRSHIIVTVRTKQDYIIVDKNGKQVPEKIGLKSIQRDGVEYEFMLSFELDIKNYARASKDRTGLFFGKAQHIPTVETGAQILEWCNSVVEPTTSEVSDRIGSCKSIGELLELFNLFPKCQKPLQKEFEAQKNKIISEETKKQLSSHSGKSQMGMV